MGLGALIEIAHNPNDSLWAPRMRFDAAAGSTALADRKIVNPVIARRLDCESLCNPPLLAAR